MEYPFRSLEEKLNMLAEGQEIGLTAAEAAIYGAEYADQDPEEDVESPDDRLPDPTSNYSGIGSC